MLRLIVLLVAVVLVVVIAVVEEREFGVMDEAVKISGMFITAGDAVLIVGEVDARQRQKGDRVRLSAIDNRGNNRSGKRAMGEAAPDSSKGRVFSRE